VVDGDLSHAGHASATAGERYGCAVPTPLRPITLTGRHVVLAPLAHDHVDALVEAASVDRSTYRLTWVPDGREAMTAYVDGLLSAHAAAEVLPFVQIDTRTGRPVGCTRYLDPQWWSGRDDPDEVEIGGTWLAASAQRTGINTEAKRLLLAHAFDTLDVWRVAICTDADNTRSRTAIDRIGAVFEGVLRNHRPRAGTTTPEARDTAVYSIVRDEWPAVRARLDAALG
jgi:RimJ/RimL family protein N-acetyltransferase